MIKDYTRPQSIIRQLLQKLPNDSARSRHAFIFGPQFDLFRYTVADERAKMVGVLFDENTNPNPSLQQLVPYEGLKTNHVVDESFVRLYGENLEGQLWNAVSHVQDADATLYDFQVVSLDQPNKVRVVRRGAIINAVAAVSTQIASATVVFGGSGYAASSSFDVPVVGGSGAGAAVRLTTNANGVVTTATVISSGYGYNANVKFNAPSAAIGANVGVKDATLVSELRGRTLRAGDIAYVQFGSTIVRRTIKRIEKEVVASHYGSDTAKANKNFAASNQNPIHTDAASFGDVAAPTNWDVKLAHDSILDYLLGAGGSGYTSAPTVNISAPLAIGSTLASVFTADDNWPTQQAAATAVVENGIVTAINPTVIGAGYFFGGVVKVMIGASGSGYSTNNPPTIAVSDPPAGGIKAVLTPVISAGGIVAVKIVDPGAGYTSAPTLTVVGGSPSVVSTMTAIINKGVQTTAISNGGSGYTSAPSITIGAPNVTGGIQATAEAVISGGAVVAIKITQSGSGYTSAPSVSFSGGGGTGAVATAAIGINPAVVLTDGGGTGATATSIIQSLPEDWDGLEEGSKYNGKFAERYTVMVTRVGTSTDDSRVRIRSASGGFSADNVTAYKYGFGYIVTHEALGGIAVDLRPSDKDEPLRLGDQFTFVVVGRYHPLELSASGQVIALNIIAGGTGYSNGAVTLSAPPAGGVQATANITVTSGAITGYTITNPGSGYVYPPKVTLSGGTGGVVDSVLATPENSRDLVAVQSSSYNGPRDTRYQITVVKGASVGKTQDSFSGAVVRVTDSAGIDSTQEFTVAHGIQYDLGTYGLKFIFPSNLVTPSGLSAGTTATGTATQSGGAVTALAITSGGSGYVVPPVVTISGGGGSGATAEAKIVNGVVSALLITSAGSGYSSNPTVTIAAPVTFQCGLRTGDVYFIDAVAEKVDGPASVVVLSGQAADVSAWAPQDLTTNLLNVEFRALYSGIIDPKRDTAPTLAWTAGNTAKGGISVKDTLRLKIVERDSGFEWVPVKESDYGRLFAHWRGLVPSTSGDSIKLYASEDDITTKFGLNDPDNPVCHGAIVAFRGAQQKPIYVGAIASNDLTGYQNILKQAERVDGATYVAPMTLDLAVQNETSEHVNKSSKEDVKFWRRAYIFTKNPGGFVIMDNDADDENFVATVSANSAGNVRVICEAGDFISRGIRPGDKFRTLYTTDAWGVQSYQEFEIQTVLENDELILKTGPAATINPAIKFEIWRPDDGVSQAEYVGERSEKFKNRRVINVWTDSPTDHDAANEVQPVDGFYLAAEIAGIRSVLLPQQGLTYTELDHALDAAPLMYTKYSTDALNIAAAKGTLIVTQESEDGPIFIRHQLTTDSVNGSLYWEDSVGVNLDEISYGVRDLVQPYIGKRNVTRETIEEIETKLRDLLDTYKVAPAAISNIGPALLNYRDLIISVDPVHRDRINIRVTLELPLPINTIVVELLAVTASDPTLATVTTNFDVAA